MPEPKKKKPLAHQALEGSMAPRKHPDEGRSARDFVSAGYKDEVPLKEAIESTQRDKDNALESAVYNDQFGRRTFPPAMDFRYATPTYRRNDEEQTRTSRQLRSKGQPFFTDSVTGEIDMTREPKEVVYAASSSSRTAARSRDKAVWPATLHDDAFTGRRNDEFLGGGDTDFDRYKRERIRQADHEVWKAKNQPVRTVLKEIWKSLGVPGRHSPNYRKPETE